MTHKHYIVLIAGSILCCAILRAQPGNISDVSIEGIDSLGMPSKTASIRFEKLLNRYLWNTFLRFNHEDGPISLSVQDHFFSSLLQTTQTFIRDEHTAGITLKQQFSPFLKGKMRFSSYSLTDNQGIGLGNAGSRGAYYGVEWSPFQRLLLNPMIGIRYDNQVERQDQGLSYLLGLEANGLESGGYQISLNGINQMDILEPRKGESFRDTIGIEKLFFGGTQTQFQFGYTRNRRDFYLGGIQQATILPDIETRTEDALNLGGILNYPGGREWNFSIQGYLLSRTIERQTHLFSSANSRSLLTPKIEEFRLEGNAEVRFIPGERFKSIAAISHQERDELYGILEDGSIAQSALDSANKAQEQKNNHANRTVLSLDILSTLTASDSIRVSFSNNLLRYDTPNLQNDDDRDELRHTIRLQTFHRLNRYLHLEWLGEATLAHLVYLSKYRSSENTWNRIFRLSPTLLYQPSQLIVTLNRFEVLANYTVYDYEYLSATVQSYTFRQFGWIDSTSVYLTARFGIDWLSTIRLYERGELRWEDFSERPLTFIDERTYTGLFHYHVSELLLFSVGVRYFNQSRFTYAGAERVPEFTLKSIGPTTIIDWRMGTWAHVQIQGLYEQITQTNQPKRSNANLTMMCNVTL